MDRTSFPAVLTLEQAAFYLQVTVEDLRIELEQGRIPGMAITGTWRVSREVLNQLLGLSTNVINPETDATASSHNLKMRELSPVAITPLIASADSSQRQRTEEVGAMSTLSVAMQQDKGKDAAQEETPETELVLDKESIESQLSDPPSGCIRAKVIRYNIEEGFGYARLSNNQTVFLDGKHLNPRGAILFPGDVIDFQWGYSRKGTPQAQSIRIASKDGMLNSSVVQKSSSSSDIKAAHTNKKLSSDIAPLDVSTSKKLSSDIAPLDVSTHITSANMHQPSSDSSSLTPPKPFTNLNGTVKSEQLYKKAAVARAEGRYDPARRLFQQAIEAGAGTQVYIAFFKMESDRGNREDARRIIKQAVDLFPEQMVLYEMYGQLERRSRNYARAEEIFREGLKRFPKGVQLLKGLAQTLVQIGDERSFREAGSIFTDLDRSGKLRKDDGLYQRYTALQSNPLANRAFDFFRMAGMIVGIAGRRERDLPAHVTDIVAETNNQELNESFGLTGAFLVRCFKKQASPTEIFSLSKYLRGIGPQNELGLQDRQVVLNSSLAFIAVPNSDVVRDQIIQILGEANEAIVPLDHSVFDNSEPPLNLLRDLLGQYLGQRDLYNSTFPVSGRRFFGREKLLIELTDAVNRGEFLGIYGLRKTGKTSLIYQLRDEKLRGEAVAYVDLQASLVPMMSNCSPLYWELEHSLYLRLRERHQDAANLLNLGRIERFSDIAEYGSRAALIFAEDLQNFLEALSNNQIVGIERLVIVLDELEKILPVAGQKIDGYLEFFRLLRGLAQTYPGRLSSVVVAANSEISERGYWGKDENPVFALYKKFPLPLFSERESSEMICALGKGMSVYWEPEATQIVFAETGGHPFLTRSFCSRIAKQYSVRPTNVTAAMVQQQILPFIRAEEYNLKQIYDLVEANFPEDAHLLDQLAQGTAPIKLPDESLRHLLEYHLIAATENGYRITLNLLRRWLRRQAGVEE